MAMPGGYSQSGYGPGYDQQPLMQGGGGYGNHPAEGNYPQGNFPQHGSGYQQPGFSPNMPTNTLKQIQTTTSMNLMFFAAAWCVIIGAFISSICLFFSFELADFLECVYLMLFGVVLAIVDTPFFKTIKMFSDFKMYISKYVNLLTRVTGKGLTFLFLGTSLFSTMWDNLEGGFLLFLAVVLCACPTIVGLAAIVIGAMKSQKLSKARAHLAMGALEQRYDQWAQTYRGPNGGLTPTEFNSLTMENGGFKWEDADLKLIFNALVSNPSWRVSTQAQGQSTGRDEPKIPKEDLISWVKGGIVWL